MNTTSTPTKIEKRNTSFIEDVTFKYMPYWPLFILMAAIFLSLGWAYTKYKNPVYEINASIQLNDEKKGANENQVDQTLNLPTAKKIVENELEVLQSRALMDSVVMQLGLYAPVYEKATLKSIPAYTTSPVIVEVRNPQNIRPQVKYDKIGFTYNSNNKTVTIDNKAYPLNQYVTTPYGEVIFRENPNVVMPAKHPLYFSLVNVKEITESILKGMDVSAVGKLSSIVKLKLKDENTKRGEDILNSLLNRYNRSTQDYKNNIAKNSLTFLDQRIASLQNELRGVEKKVQNYKTSNRITNLSDEGRLYLQDVSENDQKISNINLQLAALNQVEGYVTSKETTSGIVPASVGVGDPTLSRLVDKLYESEIQYERLKQTTAENNPMLKSLANQIAAMRPSILENIQNQKQSLLAGKNNLSRTNGNYNAVLQGIPEKEKQLLEVSRDQATKSNTYAYLLQKREQIELAYSSNTPDVKIVDYARASLLPVGPKKSMAYIFALAAAAALCAAFIAFKELFSSKILFRKDIEKLTDIPVLGEISNFKNKNQLLAPQNAVVQEQLRQIRAAAGLFHLNDNTKKILITSGIANEGKSVISSNLAYNMAQSGKKVVLIDGDIKHPEISRMMNINDQSGLANYLESNISAASIINNTEHANLFVISAGRTNINSTELLLNGRLQSLFDYLETEFDYIIIDNSPLNLITDAYIFSEYTDQTFMVIRHGFTPKNFIKNLDYDSKILSLKNLSIIFNGVKHRGFLKNDFGYGYGYENAAMMKKKLKVA